MNATEKSIKCPMCGHGAIEARPQDFGEIRGNTERYWRRLFRLWKCPKCLTIINTEAVDFHDLYRDYPLNKRKLDIFAKGTLNNLLMRLKKAGLKKTDTLLDYGCGNGIFVDYLKLRGYANVVGYDPYVADYAQLPEKQFDVVVSNDVLEHGDDLYKMVEENLSLLKPSGLLYIGTADSEPVNMRQLESEVLRLHQPFHRIIITEKSLHVLVKRDDVTLVAQYQRSYHDTRRPFSNYRFLEEINKAVGDNLDLAMDEKTTNCVFMRTPKLWFFAFFGYWFPTVIEPAVVVRKR